MKNQRERDRERAAARAGGKGKGADDGLTPEQRRERDGKALQEKAAKKAAQAAAAAGSGGGAGGKGTAKKIFAITSPELSCSGSKH
ncbi:hypothetical protein HID58_061359 [Brassica napus]|uniref:Small EDRK-rich factor-like N-terminal domain-containing protein n=1 Tax=Brassica napus TaxID=3708 RepID=A0ABQ7ZZ50_BRANA|nr:hypothetical protein HID58_061359 [Brassica napus]